MGMRHMKRKAAPKTWPIERKKAVYVTRPFPGAHALEEGMSLGVFLKEVFHYAKTQKDVKKILHHKHVLVDGRRRKDEHDMVGLFDVVEFPDVDAHFRVTLSPGGRISVIPITRDEAAIKPCQVVGKTLVGGKTQLNLSDGRNILIEKNGYKTGDTLIIGLPEQKIKKHLALEKGATIFLTGGKYQGHVGKVEGISGGRLLYKTETEEIAESHKKYAFVVGGDKPALQIAIKEQKG
jgi:small subunit ribosomal protein S4e